jgi:hypothetical protein
MLSPEALLCSIVPFPRMFVDRLTADARPEATFHRKARIWVSATRESAHRKRVAKGKYAEHAYVQRYRA